MANGWHAFQRERNQMLLADLKDTNYKSNTSVPVKHVKLHAARVNTALSELRKAEMERRSSGLRLLLQEIIEFQKNEELSRDAFVQLIELVLEKYIEHEVNTRVEEHITPYLLKSLKSQGLNI